jgi:hypothetical protein
LSRFSEAGPRPARVDGRTRKMHAGVDRHGGPPRLEIGAGEVHDGRMIEAFRNWDTKPRAIVADKAYGSGKIGQQIADAGGWAGIPPRRNAKGPIPQDPHLDFARNIVERGPCRVNMREAPPARKPPQICCISLP